MKTILTIFSFIAFFAISSQNSFSQSLDKINPDAMLSEDNVLEKSVKSECAELKRLLGLTEKQESAVTTILFITHPKKDRIKNDSNLDATERQSNLQSLAEYEMENFKKILSDSQFELYKKSVH